MLHERMVKFDVLFGGKNLGIKMPQSRMKDLIDNSELNATYKLDKFNSSQRTNRRKFLTMHFSKSKISNLVIPLGTIKIFQANFNDTIIS